MMVVGWSFPLTFLMQSKKLNKSEKYLTKEHCVFPKFHGQSFPIKLYGVKPKVVESKNNLKSREKFVC